VNAFKRALEVYPGCPQRKTIVEIILGIEQGLPVTTAQNNTNTQ
jgi:hypothetical protein